MRRGSPTGEAHDGPVGGKRVDGTTGREEATVHARVSSYQGTGGSIESSLEQLDEVVPVVRGMDGSRGLIYLVDRGSGKSISITLWESADAMRASEDAANRLRRDSSASSGDTIVGVERYEVAFLDVSEGS